MINEVNLPLIIIAALLATASPGPATLAIAGTAACYCRYSRLLLPVQPLAIAGTAACYCRYSRLLLPVQQ